jgi:hypothetical protein
LNSADGINLSFPSLDPFAALHNCRIACQFSETARGTQFHEPQCKADVVPQFHGEK